MKIGKHCILGQTDGTNATIATLISVQLQTNSLCILKTLYLLTEFESVTSKISLIDEYL
jgi:hypothetical protein